MKSNILYTYDNLYIMSGMNSQSVDLIYLDPPFNSKRTYSAPIGSKAAGSSFKDMWTWQDVDEQHLETLFDSFPDMVSYIRTISGAHSKAMMAYCTYMAQRIIEMHRVLKDTGSLYLHCDQTASHYLKIILDCIFGKNSFRNEIIWHYRRWTAGNRNFQKMHDTLFRYCKGADFVFNVQYEPYGDWIEKDYSYVDEETGKRWRWHTIKGVRYKVFLEDKDRGVKINDVWRINHISSTSKERTGYPTQKPLKLLERIIESSSNEGDVVFDPFAGCATTCVAAQRAQRKWIGIDIEEKAVDVLLQRLGDDAGIFKDFIHLTKPPQRTDIKPAPINADIKLKLYSNQKGICNGCKNNYHQKDLEIDHIVPKSKGGGDYFENYQLLCGNCNRMKSNNPMAYLLSKLKKLEEKRRNEITF